jgi:hypothetical protein
VLLYPAFNITPLRYYLRREFCTILPTSTAEINGQPVEAARTFAVLSHLKIPESRIRTLMDAYGREREHFDSLRVAIIEYQRY